MNAKSRGLVSALAVAFLLVGLGWLVAPATVSSPFRMPLLEGAGLSTQVGDLGSFFLTLGACILIAARTGDRRWLYPPIMLLGFAATGRVVAWLLHDAALTSDLVGIELAACFTLFAVSRTMTTETP